jgi:hypothetical protein
MRRMGLMGLLVGIIHSGFTLYSMITPLAYSTWDVLNNVIFVVNLAVLLTLATMNAIHGWSVRRIVVGSAVYSALFTGIYLLTYSISTWLFADQLVQLPFFLKDYTYHGYQSPREYLFAGSNYADLMQLQVFSMGIVLLFQTMLGGLIGTIAGHIPALRRPVPA